MNITFTGLNSRKVTAEDTDHRRQTQHARPSGHSDSIAATIAANLAGWKEADSTKLADLLELRASAPDAFAQLLAVNWRQVRNWER